MEVSYSTYSFADLLSNIVDNRGKTCPVVEEGLPLIATNCIKNDTLHPVFEKVRFVDKETYKTWFRGHPEPGDLIFVCKGSPGNVCWTPDPVNFCIAQDMVAIRADDRIVNSKYLFALLRSPITQAKILNMHVGTLIPHFKKGDFKNLYFDIPNDRSVQEAIGNFYLLLSEKIELNRKMNETLEGMAQALFKSWFVDFDPVIDKAIAADNLIPEPLQKRATARRALGTKRKPLPGDIEKLFPSSFVFTDELGWIPEGWEVKKLSDLLEVKYGKDHKKLEDGQIPVYGSGGLMRRANSSLYKGESVLIPRKGTLSNILYLNEEFWTVDTMFYTIPRTEYIPKYAFCHLKRLDFSSMNVGSAVPSMTTKVLNELPILLPSEIVLREFDAILTSYYDRVAASNEESLIITRTSDTLLPKLLSGELRIPDAGN